MTYSTAHFERALPIVAELDLGALASGFQAARSGDIEGLQGVLAAFAKAGQTKILRRLVAVKRATPDELLESEDSLPSLEIEVAKSEFQGVLKEAVDFFDGLGLSWKAIQGSSATEAAADPADPSPSPDASLSAAS